MTLIDMFDHGRFDGLELIGDWFVENKDKLAVTVRFGGVEWFFVDRRWRFVIFDNNRCGFGVFGPAEGEETFAN